MAGLEESLRAHENFNVQKRIELLSDIEQVNPINVDLFLFDNSLPEANKIESIIGDQSGILILGLDVGKHFLNVIPPKGIPIENFYDLANLIFKLTNRQTELNPSIHQGAIQ